MKVIKNYIESINNVVEGKFINRISKPLFQQSRKDRQNAARLKFYKSAGLL